VKKLTIVAGAESTTSRFQRHMSLMGSLPIHRRADSVPHGMPKPQKTR
jgi:hypothetical protein